MSNVKIWECFGDWIATGRCRQQPEALESVEVLGWWPRWYLDREARLNGCGNVWNVAFTVERWSSEYVHMIYARCYKVATENLQFEDRAWSYCVPRHHWGGPEGHHAETRHRLEQQLQQIWKMRGFSVSVMYSDTTFTGWLFLNQQAFFVSLLMCYIVAFQNRFRDIHWRAFELVQPFTVHLHEAAMMHRQKWNRRRRISSTVGRTVTHFRPLNYPRTIFV